MSDIAIKLTDIVKNVKKDNRTIPILKGINIEIEKGSITAITGKSGSGKTTLLSIASGLDRPTKGNVRILGKDFYRLKNEEQDTFRNRNIGLLFQNYHLIAQLTCEENIRMPLAFSDKKIKDDKLNSWVKSVGLDNKRNLYPHQLSGGEQQRTAILRAIMNEPEIIFADEPTGALDSKTGNQIINFLIAYAHKYAKTIVLVTHDMEIAKMCDRMIEMEDGKINVEPSIRDISLILEKDCPITKVSE